MFKKMAHGFFCIGQGDVGTLLKKAAAATGSQSFEKTNTEFANVYLFASCLPCLKIHAFSLL
jgi:hypothetical protein